MKFQVFRPVAVLLLTLFSVASVCNAQEATPKKSPPPLSLETLFHPDKKFDYDGKGIVARWVNDQPPTLIVRRDGDWMQVDLPSGNESPWPVVEKFRQQLLTLPGINEKKAKESALRAAGAVKNSDQTLLLQIDKSLALVSADKPARWLTRDASSWQNAALDPTGRRVAYTREGDLFVLDIASGRTYRMTQDASDTILDGVLDWTYQEEIYGRGNYRAFWFSPNGEWLAMLRTDISAIEPYTITAASTQRGSSLVRRYSKAGDPIPHATLYVFDLRGFSTTGVPPAKMIAQSTPQQERIISGVWWNTKAGQLMYCISDRKQTWRELRYIDEAFLVGATTKTKRLHREESPAWVEPPLAPIFLDGGHVLWLSDVPSGMRRLYWIHNDGSVVLPLSPEDFDIRDLWVNKSASMAVVTGDASGDNSQQHAYRIDFQQAQNQPPVLVPLTNTPGWHSVVANEEGTAFLDRHSTLKGPPSVTVRSTLLSAEPIKLGSDRLTTPKPITPPELLQIETPDGVQLPAVLYRPSDASKDSPCPVVVEIYGGPQAPVALDRWSGTRSLYRELLAREGIAVLVLDNRSSNGRGVADTWAVRGKFGEIELQDLLTGVNWLKEKDWVNNKRIAVRGWSFGGYMTLYAMTHSKDFAAGIAGGSVTDWLEYDSFYTERYMGLPDENPDGYKNSSPIHNAAELHGHVLMIHGEVDDNVHPSGTLRMAAELQKAGKDFEMMIYPGSAHAVRDPAQVWHMQKMTHQFLKRRLLAPISPVAPAFPTDSQIPSSPSESSQTP